MKDALCSECNEWFDGNDPKQVKIHRHDSLLDSCAKMPIAEVFADADKRLEKLSEQIEALAQRVKTLEEARAAASGSMI
jgi:dephospho-CoA kinase